LYRNHPPATTCQRIFTFYNDVIRIVLRRQLDCKQRGKPQPGALDCKLLQLAEHQSARNRKRQVPCLFMLQYLGYPTNIWVDVLHWGANSHAAQQTFYAFFSGKMPATEVWCSGCQRLSDQKSGYRLTTQGCNGWTCGRS